MFLTHGKKYPSILDNLDVVLLYLDSIKLYYKFSLCNQINN